MTALVLFGSTFVLVFALGLQSLNVNRGHYVWAFLTSFVIGASNMVLLKLGPDASLLEVAGYLCGGPLGIVASMWAHPWLTGRRRVDEHAEAHYAGGEFINLRPVRGQYPPKPPPPRPRAAPPARIAAPRRRP